MRVIVAARLVVGLKSISQGEQDGNSWAEAGIVVHR